MVLGKQGVAMRQRVLGVILALGVFVSVMEGRFYLGVSGGYSAQSIYATQIEVGSRIFAIHTNEAITEAFKGKQKGYSLELVWGAEDFYSRYFGTRYGISGGYTSLKEFQTGDVGLSFDFLLDFFNNRDFGIGIFGGIGLNYHHWISQKSSGFSQSTGRSFIDLDGRVGASISIFGDHRIEAFARLPIVSIKLKNNPILFARVIFGGSYKIIF